MWNPYQPERIWVFFPKPKLYNQCFIFPKKQLHSRIIFLNFYEVFLNMGLSGYQNSNFCGEDLIVCFCNLSNPLHKTILFLSGASLGPPGRPHMRQDFVHLQDLASIFCFHGLFRPGVVFFMFCFRPGMCVFMFFSLRGVCFMFVFAPGCVSSFLFESYYKIIL